MCKHAIHITWIIHGGQEVSPETLEGERLGYAANVTYICNASMGDLRGMGRLLRFSSVPFHPNKGPGFAQGAATKWARDQNRKPVPKLSLWILKRAADLLEVSCQQLSLQAPPSLAANQASRSLARSGNW